MDKILTVLQLNYLNTTPMVKYCQVVNFNTIDNFTVSLLGGYTTHNSIFSCGAFCFVKYKSHRREKRVVVGRSVRPFQKFLLK